MLETLHRVGGENENSSLEAGGPKTYTCGALTYTQWGLIALFASLLWGDFCFTLMETVAPRVLPLQLKSLGTSNLLMGLFITTIPGALNMVMTPMVSFQSDRYRSRWGRRIPFLFWPTPFIALFLILLGYSEETGRWLGRALTSMHFALSPMTVILGWVGVLMILFQFFNMYVASVYYYLFNDVVPEQLLGRFMALFRIFGAAAGFVFSMFIFKHAETHTREIYLGCALLYLFGFLFMCWKVKEGTYPPPPETGETPGFVSACKVYFRECFSHRYYLFFFLATAIWSMSGSCGTFLVFFQKSIGLNLAQIGAIGAWCSLPSMILLYIAGYYVDRFHPLRLILLCAILTIPLNLAYMFLVHGLWSFVVISIISIPIGALWSAANLPMYMELLPRERYGQFCSAQALIDATFRIIGGFLAGLFIDLCTKKGALVANYRYCYLWAFVLQIFSLFFLILVYQSWIKYGGKDHYAPPSVEKRP